MWQLRAHILYLKNAHVARKTEDLLCATTKTAQPNKYILEKEMRVTMVSKKFNLKKKGERCFLSVFY